MWFPDKSGISHFVIDKSQIAGVNIALSIRSAVVEFCDFMISGCWVSGTTNSTDHSVLSPKLWMSNRVLTAAGQHDCEFDFVQSQAHR